MTECQHRHVRNIYGDEIIHLNARSICRDCGQRFLRLDGVGPIGKPVRSGPWLSADDVVLMVFVLILVAVVVGGWLVFTS